MNMLVKHETGQVMLEGLGICSNFFQRLTGYLLTTNLEAPGLLFLNTPRVHTLGMQFSLDIYYFDASMRYLGSSLAVRPMRFPMSLPGTSHILEIPHNHDKQPLNLETGDLVSILRSPKK